MKKGVKPISYSLVAVLALSMVFAGPRLGPIGVDVVSAATGETTPPVVTAPKPTAPAPKPAAPKPAVPKAPVVVKTPVVVKVPAQAATKVTVKLGKAEFAAHGTKCFTVAGVVMAGDKIAAAYLDDYQFMASVGSVAVPNSTADFGKSYPAGKVLASKRANADTYSANMAKSAGATTPVDKSLDAIQAYTVGKTIAQLEATLAKNTKEQMVDAVSGATLVDTDGYVKAIVAAAKDAKDNGSIELDAVALKTLKLGKAELAAHGTKCFTVAFTAVADGKIVGTLVDDYQFMAKETSVAVPNSDVDFGKNYPEGKVLASKLANAVTYSANMAKSAGSKVPVDKSLAAIQAYATGKTTAELDKALETNGKEKMVDVVSGATLVDTYGYVSAIVAAAKSTIPVADALTSASLVNNEAAFEKGISKDGKWIISTLKNLTFDKELVLDGNFVNTKTPPASARKISLYAQDDKKNVTARYILTAPKLTINSPDARIQSGTFKGDLYVAAKNFSLVDAKVDGNVYFTTQEAKDTFTIDNKSSITGKQVVAGVDVVSSASLVQDAQTFEKALRSQGQGTWIIAALNNMTFSKPLVLEGIYHDKNDANKAIYRKIALYTQDDKRVTLSKFTLTAPKLTIKSQNANISKGTFKGDLYISAKNFKLVDAIVNGNVYFTTQEAKDTFTMDATSSITGKQILADVDAITTATVTQVQDVAAFEKQISKEGSWIIVPITDLTTDKALVVEGTFHDKNDVTKDIKRKVGLYTQDDKRVVTRRFTLTAPSLTIKSPSTTLQYGFFVGDIYVEANNFNLTNNKVTGNIYFATEEAKATFTMVNSSVSGVQELKTK